jgi:hypothetical protein
MSKKKYIIAAVTSPQQRLDRHGKTYSMPDTYLVTISPTLAEAKDYIDEGKVRDANAFEYLVIEESTELATKTQILRWYISKDKEITQLACAPDEYKNYKSMISM